MVSNIMVPNRVILWENHKGNSIRNFDWKKCSPEMVLSGGGGRGAYSQLQIFGESDE